MGDVFGKPAIVTDTHCIRLCNRIGLVDNCKDPAKVEKALWKIIPPRRETASATAWWITAAQSARRAIKPYCDKCCLADICRARKEFANE